MLSRARLLIGLLALVAPFALSSCGDGDGGGAAPTAPPTIAMVVVTPASSQVQAGATVQYGASALDGSGAPISGVTFAWSSANTAVATVDQTGLATGVVEGATDIRATASGVTGSGTIVVVPNSNADPPDDNFLDTNGDGIDGDAAKAVFVATTGSDANPGTRSAPKKTLAAAIAAAVADGSKTEVYVSSGTYAETVQLADGISIYGGYDAAASWDRSATNVATIQGDTTAVFGVSIASRTVVDRITVKSADNTATGGNSTGIYLAGSDSVVLRNLTITVGNGGSGAAGAVGAPGAPGGDGSDAIVPNGGPVFGGPGGFGAGGNDGGVGGNGGDPGAAPPLTDGQPGMPGLGPNPGSGGAGGPDAIISCNQHDPLSDGTAGGAGAAGAVGAPGASGDGLGSVVGGHWKGSDGAAGLSSGDPGSGGGGGGGGGVGPACEPTRGGGGGGGGGGGEGGAPGTGGTGGGGSFGVFAYNSNATIEASDITSGAGGAGGAGGPGGAGGAGGAGGTGPNLSGEVNTQGGSAGNGGAGGAGGAGGNGGPGGGGGGGISYAVYAAGTSTVQIDPGTTLTAGTGGAGGTAAPGGIAGTDGASGGKNF